MKTIDCVQGTPEWFAARCGVPTSSNFDKIVTTKGEASKQKRKYQYKLAGEMIAGTSEESYQNEVMQRGKELEAEARQMYCLIKNTEVQEVGFCLVDGYGASPDGLVGEKGLIEIKCPTMAVHVGYLMQEELPMDYFQQIQGQLLVTGRKWCDFISYYPAIKPFIIRVKRDKKFIDQLEVELRIFCLELKGVINKIK